jgi:hypothetical protein
MFSQKQFPVFSQITEYHISKDAVQSVCCNEAEIQASIVSKQVEGGS